MNPFALVDGKPYPLDMRGELDDTAAFKNFKKYLSFPLVIITFSVSSYICQALYWCFSLPLSITPYII